MLPYLVFKRLSHTIASVLYYPLPFFTLYIIITFFFHINPFLSSKFHHCFHVIPLVQIIKYLFLFFLEVVYSIKPIYWLVITKPKKYFQNKQVNPPTGGLPSYFAIVYLLLLVKESRNKGQTICTIKTRIVFSTLFYYHASENSSIT